MTTYQIRITNDVYQDLKKMAVPFNDKPNTVIRRLLDNNIICSKCGINIIPTNMKGCNNDR